MAGVQQLGPALLVRALRVLRGPMRLFCDLRFLFREFGGATRVKSPYKGLGDSEAFHRCFRLSGALIYPGSLIIPFV